MREAQFGMGNAAQGAGIMNAAYGQEAQAGMNAAGARYQGDLESSAFNSSMTGNLFDFGQSVLLNSDAFNAWLTGKKKVAAPGTASAAGDVSSPAPFGLPFNDGYNPNQDTALGVSGMAAPYQPAAGAEPVYQPPAQSFYTPPAPYVNQGAGGYPFGFPSSYVGLPKQKTLPYAAWPFPRG
jgi:hypothetical protein